MYWECIILWIVLYNPKVALQIYKERNWNTYYISDRRYYLSFPVDGNHSEPGIKIILTKIIGHYTGTRETLSQRSTYHSYLSCLPKL